jgi:ATP-dependent DNA ligase
MTFISPALASPFPEDFEVEEGEWFAEEKYDGHRLVVEVGLPDRGLGPVVRAWSRDGKDRLLPPHLRLPLETLLPGVYDGELIVPGQRSYGVPVLETLKDQVYVLFDVLRVGSDDLTTVGLGAVYKDRRAMLEEIVKSTFPQQPIASSGASFPVQLGWARPLLSEEYLHEEALDVWERDGEGLILKSVASTYTPGKRQRDWLKVKQIRQAVLRVVGYRPGKLGPHSTLLLEDEEGVQTIVKWKSLEELAKLDANPESAIGRHLVIEFQELTPDGSYRHPRWDHWAEPDEVGNG